MRRTMLGGLAAVALLVGACGSSQPSASPATTGAGGSPTETESVDAECLETPTAAADTSAIPEGFPIPDEMTVTDVSLSGPSVVVEGVWAGDLDAAYQGWQDAFTSAGYTITDQEKEERDAEVNFEGEGVNGQVRLDGECPDRTGVTITIRPA
jgi:hypothetical protein